MEKNFFLGELCTLDSKFRCRIKGKVSGCNAYVVGLSIYTDFYLGSYSLNEVYGSFGHPIRNTKLEWGSFSDSVIELVVDGSLLEKCR